MPDPDAPHPLSLITVVCTGNICRSPMGEIMLADALAKSDDARLHNITVTSCGLGDWHVGDGADPRAVKQLADQGYDGSEHIAATFGPEHEAADIFLRSEEHTSELQSRFDLVCRLLLEKKKVKQIHWHDI